MHKQNRAIGEAWGTGCGCLLNLIIFGVVLWLLAVSGLLGLLFSLVYLIFSFLLTILGL